MPTRREVVAAWPVLRPRWRSLLALAATGFTAFNALMYAAAHLTGAVNLTILQGAIPIFVLIGSAQLLGAGSIRITAPRPSAAHVGQRLARPIMVVARPGPPTGAVRP